MVVIDKLGMVMVSKSKLPVWHHSLLSCWINYIYYHLHHFFLSVSHLWLHSSRAHVRHDHQRKQQQRGELVHRYMLSSSALPELYVQRKRTPAEITLPLQYWWLFLRSVVLLQCSTSPFRPVWEQMWIHRLSAGPGRGASAGYRQTSGPTFALMSAPDSQFACCE